MYRRLPEPGTPDYKRAEAHWKKNISYTHNFFCSCNNYLSHFKWPGFRDELGFGGGTVTTGVVRGPLDGASITGHGSPADVRDAIHAAVAFDLDDTG
nr:MAG: ORF2 [Giant panda anellovirus]USZ80606.1 ORF2 [Tick-associated anellovirus 9]